MRSCHSAVLALCALLNNPNHPPLASHSATLRSQQCSVESSNTCLETFLSVSLRKKMELMSMNISSVCSLWGWYINLFKPWYSVATETLAWGFELTQHWGGIYLLVPNYTFQGCLSTTDLWEAQPKWSGCPWQSRQPTLWLGTAGLGGQNRIFHYLMR